MANFVRSESVVRDAVNFCADSDVIEVSSDRVIICNTSIGIEMVTQPLMSSGASLLLHPVGRRRQRERQGGPHHSGKPLLRGEWVTYMYCFKLTKPMHYVHNVDVCAECCKIVSVA